MKKSSTAAKLGKGLAYIQDNIDMALNWGFRKMKKIKLDEEDANRHKSMAKRGANKVFTFLGDFGESFYKEYDRLKSKRTKKK